MPNAFDGSFVPQGWMPDNLSGIGAGIPVGADQLYLQVIKPTCRLCHIQRDYLTDRNIAKQDSPISFKNFNDFIKFKDDIEKWVYDDARMPLAKRTFDHFWNRGQAELLAQYLDTLVSPFQRYDSNNNVLQPGRPIAATPYTANLAPELANADLKRYMATRSTINLDASASVFAQNYNWTVIPPAGGTYTMSGSTSATPSFTANNDGDYTLQLIVDDGKGNTSAPASLVVSASSTYVPVSFSADLYPVFDRVSGKYQLPDYPTHIQPFNGCMNCHAKIEEDLTYIGPQSVSHAPTYDSQTYLWSLSGTPNEVYSNLLDRINIHDPLESRLLNVGSVAHHKNLYTTNSGWGYDDRIGNWQHFNLLLRWINAGAPFN